MNQVRKTSQAGFTLVELSLAMAFIAMILLAVAMLTIQISGTYNKGLTMRSVNEAGQLISRDIQQTLNTSVPGDVIVLDSDTTGGRLCANSVVYAWNYAGHLQDGFGGRNRGPTGTDVRLVRISADNSYCRRDGSGQYPMLSLSGPGASDFTELLGGGDNTLALSKFTLEESSVKNDVDQKMYAVSFILGTSEGNIIESNDCDVPESIVDDEYCAVNVFEFTARAGNKSAVRDGE